MADIVEIGFDYTGIPAELAQKARLSAERIKIRMKRTAEDIVEIGRELVEIKEALPHGRFLPWVEAEFGMSDQQARRFIQVHEKFGDQIQHYVEFQPTVLYALSAPSTPPEVITQATDAADTGEKVTLKQVQEWKRLYEHANKAREDAQETIEDLKEKLDITTERANDQLAKASILALKMAEQADEIKRLETIPPKEKLVEVVPEGFKTVDEAIAAKKNELECMDSEFQRIEKERKKQQKAIDALEEKRIREEKRLADVEKQVKIMGSDIADAGFKKSQIRGCIDTIRTFVGNMAKYDLIIHNCVLYPDIDADLEEMRTAVKEAQNHLNNIVRPTVVKNITPIHTVIEHKEAI